ncbi:MAG TPA: DUF4301 family protein [bacterium]|nr:DUF4301 family protein [bacterium]
MTLTHDDLRQLSARGIGEAEALRQLALLASPPPAMRLLRPCTVGDGVLRLDAARQAGLERRGAGCLERVRTAKFVPASGAASRMFKDLLEALQQDGLPAGAAATVLERAQHFAFEPLWLAASGARDAKAFAMLLAKGEWRRVLESLLFAPGMDYSRLPKAYVEFHRVAGRPRTAFESHWREAAALDLKRLHFTLSPEHVDGYLALVAVLGPLLQSEGLPPMQLGYSFQDPATDTLAGDGQGGPFRDAAGALVLRPGGHGSLLKNLQDLARDVDVAVLKNIDNIAHPRLWPEQLRWKRILVGLLDETCGGDWDRPVRVAGVVRNTGEPGGGPFWVQDHGSESPQIVESAQVDLADPGQAAIFRGATHFNPVDLVCRLTDPDGVPFELERYLDPAAVFVAKKSHLGRPLVALERPGLWNGAMARWKTVFVEVPLGTFNPVKTVLDLLKDAHQEGGL